ncbi:UNVERIFIED_CONTAM: hypothetical protein FKN15_078330 [Acipenser sinensis]
MALGGPGGTLNKQPQKSKVKQSEAKSSREMFQLVPSSVCEILYPSYNSTPPQTQPPAALFFHHSTHPVERRQSTVDIAAVLKRLTMQPPKSYSVGGQRSSRAASGKPAGARPEYRGHWCTVSRGHPDRPNPPSPRATLGQLCAAPWELQSSIGKRIAWIRTRDLQAIERILHSRGAPLLDAPLGSPA